MTRTSQIPAKEVINTNELCDFLHAAKNYCHFIETENSVRDIAFLKMTQAHLVTLYALARNLPSVHLHVEKDFESDIDNSDMKPLLKFIGDRVPFSYYWLVLNPVDTKDFADTGTGDLTDDLGDIYKDLKRAIVIYDTNDTEAKGNAVWKFKFDFDFHWGEHCIDALSAIHHYLAENE